MRAATAAQKRAAREAVQRQREFERRAKENAKLSALEQARLEVETHDNKFEVLLSVHKDQGELLDWNTLASRLPAPPPRKNSRHELRATQNSLVLRPEQRDSVGAEIEKARIEDEDAFRGAELAYDEEYREWKKLNDLSQRVRAGDAQAYREVMEQLTPLTEISHFGSSIDFTVHNPRFVECAVAVNGAQSIPSETKTLSASGKVSVKAIPLSRLHEIYQDYVCSCMLRVAREVFAALPVDQVLVTASTSVFDSATGQTSAKPVLSTAITRAQFSELNFDVLDPSDAIGRLVHRGEFKASRKTGAFLPITPLKPCDIGEASVETMGLGDLLGKAALLRAQLADDRGELQ